MVDTSARCAVVVEAWRTQTTEFDKVTSCTSALYMAERILLHNTRHSTPLPDNHGTTASPVAKALPHNSPAPVKV